MNRSTALARTPSPIPTWMLTMASLLLLLWLTAGVSAETTGSSWAFPDRSYRVPITVSANGTARTDRVAEVALDFDALLADLGATGSVNADSLRLVETDGSGSAIDTAVPFQLNTQNTAATADDTLNILLAGTTAAGTARTFHLYFDTGSGFTAPTFTDLVARQADIAYRGQDSFVIITYDSSGSETATYFYHQKGGAFATIRDKDGNDWISYYGSAGSQSGGEFRGIPNLGKVFHPGYSNNSGSDQGSDSSVLGDGPLKLTIQSISKDGEWEARWDIYPTYAQMTLVNHPDGENYWFLYEGTPGGNLEYSGGDQDQIVRSDGTTNNAGTSWKGASIPQELSPEWIYVQDSVVDRIFFLSHSLDDAQPDSYRHQYNATQNPPNASSDNGAMTVFGFGRHIDGGTTKYLSADNPVFTIGFGETTTFNDAAATIANATEPLAVTVGNEAPAVTTNNGLTVTEGTTAVLTPSHLTATDPEGGAVTFTLTGAPDHGQLTRQGTPLAVNDTFTQADIAAGHVAYAHDGSETSSDGVDFAIADGVQTGGTGTLAMSITAVNDAPTANPDSVTMRAGGLVTIDLLANDSDPDGPTLTVTELTRVDNGILINNGNGTVSYTPKFGFEGSDSFTYRASDGSKKSAVTSVTITVEPPLRLFLPMITKP